MNGTATSGTATPATIDPKKALRLEVTKLRARKGAEWNELVREIQDRSVQVKVACIVWWDFFSNRTLDKRWTELDEFLTDAFNPSLPEPAVEAVQEGLVAVGYPPAIAVRRTKISDEEY